MPEAWVWVEKPNVRVVPISPQPLSERWLAVFASRSAFLPCLGAAKLGKPCGRHVQQWHHFFRGRSITTFSAYCATHRPPEEELPWNLWGATQTISCPCGCGASAVVLGRGLTTDPGWADAAWRAVLTHLGSAQWRDSQGSWMASGDEGAITWRPEIPNTADVAVYRNWLFEGPRAWWECDE